MFLNVLFAVLFQISWSFLDDEALLRDDQCAAVTEDCALNALQRQGKKAAKSVHRGTESSSASRQPWSESCAVYGCNERFWGYLADASCRCDVQCSKYGSCCADYVTTCRPSYTFGPVAPNQPTGPGPFPPSPTLPQCFALPKTYSLAFRAQGKTFFDGFTFVTNDDTHGAQRYLSKDEAIRSGIASASDRGVMLRLGQVVANVDPIAPYKRQSVNLHSNFAWSPTEGFLVVMKYKHIPYGASIWPAFWLMNSDVVWPAGGEFDIMEYANDETSKFSFHTDKSCFLDQVKMNSCIYGRMVGEAGSTNCKTNYFQNLMGCRPPHIERTGEWYAKTPGVIAAVWADSAITVYHIPESRIPVDLATDSPRPFTWDEFVIAYLPFSKDSCQDVARPQEVVINIALCGDWAGNTWLKSPLAYATGVTSGCSESLSVPKDDCCSKFATDNSPGTNDYFQRQGFFDIDYVKVFTPEGHSKQPLMSGTYRRGGAPMK